MDMSMSSMTMSGMAMPTSTSTSSSTSSTMSMTGMSMSMQDMAMVFFTSTITPLYSNSWTPSSTGQYAGTCIFLFLLSAMLRFMYACKNLLEITWREKTLQRRYVRVAEPLGGHERERGGLRPSEGKGMTSTTSTLTTNGLDENVRVVQRGDALMGGLWSRPWRLSVDLPRALLVTVMLGIAYLLMLAVMTMNVGYFISVLAGVFVGELFFGRFATHFEQEHH